MDRTELADTRFCNTIQCRTIWLSVPWTPFISSPEVLFTKWASTYQAQQHFFLFSLTSVQHQRQVMHSGSLLQYQCNSGPWTIEYHTIFFNIKNTIQYTKRHIHMCSRFIFSCPDSSFPIPCSSSANCKVAMWSYFWPFFWTFLRLSCPHIVSSVKGCGEAKGKVALR